MVASWALWLAASVGASCEGEVAAAPLVARAGEVLVYTVEVSGASVGTWQSGVVQGAGDALVLRAQMAVDPLLAAFLPARAQMKVALGADGASCTEAAMLRARAEVEEQVDWRFRPGRPPTAVQVGVRRLAGPPAEHRRWTAEAPGHFVDPLRAFFLLRQGAGAPSRCLRVAAPDGVWRLALERLETGPHKTSVGWRPSHHYRLFYAPEKRSPTARAVEGELWQAAQGEPLIWEVRVERPRSVRMVLTRYEKAAVSRG